MTFAVFPGPTPGGGGTGLCRGSGPVGLGPWGALGPPCPPTGALPPPGAPQAIDNLPGWIWQAEVELDRMTFAVFPGPRPGGGGAGPGRGSGPVGLGPWGPLGPPPPPAKPPAPTGIRARYSRFLAHLPGRVGVGQDDVRGVPGPRPRGGRRRPRQGVWSGGSGALGAPGTAPTARQTAGPGRHRNQAPGLSLFCCIMGVSGNPQIEGVSAGEHAAALRGTRTDERATVLRPQSATQTPLGPRKIPDPTEMWF